MVRDFLEVRFPDAFLRLNPSDYKTFVLKLPDQAITGGSSYDALVAATAATFDAELFTCDRRALPIYERYGVRTQLLS